MRFNRAPARGPQRSRSRDVWTYEQLLNAIGDAQEGRVGEILLQDDIILPETLSLEGLRFPLTFRSLGLSRLLPASSTVTTAVKVGGASASALLTPIRFDGVYFGGLPFDADDPVADATFWATCIQHTSNAQLELVGCRMWATSAFTSKSAGFLFKALATGNFFQSDTGNYHPLGGAWIDSVIHGNRGQFSIVVDSAGGDNSIVGNSLAGGDITTTAGAGSNTISANTDTGTITAHASDSTNGDNE